MGAAIPGAEGGSEAASESIRLGIMEFGAHLPQIAFRPQEIGLAGLRSYADAARGAGFAYLAANDHLVFPRGWWDAPSALGAVLDRADGMRIMTTVALPVVRGPAATARWLAAVDCLTEGRLIAGVSAGSSQQDYRLAGVPWDERWARLDECIHVIRALWRAQRYQGQFYAADGTHIEPHVSRSGGPPIWVGSWGSEAGLHRAATLADGWIASAYNTTPDAFAQARRQIEAELEARGRDGSRFRNAVATMWTYITDDEAEASRLLRHVLAPALNREPDALAPRVMVGTPDHCARLLAEYAAAGAQRLSIWPIHGEEAQLWRFREQVVPLAAQYRTQYASEYDEVGAV